MFNFETIQKQSQSNIESVTKSYEAFSKGFQAMSKEAMEYSKKQAEASSAAFENVVASKSFEKAYEVQSDFAKASFEEFVSQANKMGQLYMDVAKDAYKPFEKAAAVSTK